MRLRFLDLTATLVTEDEVQYLGTVETINGIVDGFLNGAKIADLGVGAESVIREAMMLGPQFEFISIEEILRQQAERAGVQVPPEARN